MKTKITNFLLVFAVLFVMLSSFFTLPVLAAEDDGVSPFAYETFYSQAFIGSYNTGTYYMDGNYMAFEITCISEDKQNHPVYVHLYRAYCDQITTFTVHSDGVKRKYDYISTGGGTAATFVLSCNENVKISFNLVFYSWDN